VGKVDWLAAGLPSEGEDASELRIGSIADKDVATCRLDQRIGDLKPKSDLYVVINDERIVLGDLREKALRADPSTFVEQVMNPAPSTYRPNVSVHEMLHTFEKSDAQRVLVADADGRLVGLVTRDQVKQVDHDQQQRKRNGGPVLASSSS
jgi:Mg/Co/Ni transporter MgtE